jgi:hypothetical protein
VQCQDVQEAVHRSTQLQREVERLLHNLNDHLEEVEEYLDERRRLT